MENIFRPEYKELSEEEKVNIKLLKDKAFELLSLMNIDNYGLGKDRETSIAITKLEESIMWAVKSLSK